MWQCLRAISARRAGRRRGESGNALSNGHAGRGDDYRDGRKRLVFECGSVSERYRPGVPVVAVVNPGMHYRMATPAAVTITGMGGSGSSLNVAVSPSDIGPAPITDRKSTRLNSSHLSI